MALIAVFGWLDLSTEWEEFLGMTSLPSPTGDHFLPTMLLKNSKHRHQTKKEKKKTTTLHNTVKSA